MNQLIAHLIGDYILQNHWMANRKTKEWAPALAHVLLYGVPFAFLVPSVEAWLVIVATHLVIDRYRLAAYWVDFWGTGKEGALTVCVMHLRGFDLADGPVWTDGVQVVDRTPAAPPFLAVWLLILVDNTMHLTINALAIALL